jgi:hypothetical protein
MLASTLCTHSQHQLRGTASSAARAAKPAVTATARSDKIVAWLHLVIWAMQQHPPENNSSCKRADCTLPR